MEKRAPLNERVFVLPLEGKGDRSAVDEVTCGHAPLRGAFGAEISLSIASDSDLTAKLSLALTRGAGVCLLAGGSLWPRRELCGGVNPSNPPARRRAPPRRVERSGAFTRGRTAQPDIASVAPDIRSLAHFQRH